MLNTIFRFSILGFLTFWSGPAFTKTCPENVLDLTQKSSNRSMTAVLSAMEIASNKIGEARYGLLSSAKSLPVKQLRLLMAEALRGFSDLQWLGNPSPHGVAFRWIEGESKQILSKSLSMPASQVFISDRPRRAFRGSSVFEKGNYAINGFQRSHFREGYVIGSQSFGLSGFPQLSQGPRVVSESDPIAPLKDLLSHTGIRNRGIRNSPIKPEVYSFDVVAIDLRGPQSQRIPDDGDVYYNLFHVLTVHIGDETAFLVTEDRNFGRISKTEANKLYALPVGL